MAKTMSLKPEDMVTGGGGILSDTNTRWNKLRFEMFDYDGKAPTAPVLRIDYTDLDAEADFVQRWTIGNAQDYIPSKDGLSVITDKPLRASSNMGMLWASLANNIGEEEFSTHIGEDITTLEGLEAHMIQVPDPRPTAKARKDKKTGREYPATVPIVDVVHKLPWDKGGKKTVSTSDVGDAEKTIIAFIKATLAGAKDGMAQNPLAIAAFQNIEGDEKFKTVAATLIHDENFIKGIDGITFENGILKLG